MADIVVKAAYATVADEDGLRYVGFVDALEESYALFRQPVTGGPVWFEVNDEDFGAEDAILSAQFRDGSLEIALRPGVAGRFGYAQSVSIRLKSCEGGEAALKALAGMTGLALD
ncbi:MAG: hypothetical protein QM656_15590 [Paracoccaceae bacterium]